MTLSVHYDFAGGNSGIGTYFDHVYSVWPAANVNLMHQIRLTLLKTFVNNFAKQIRNCYLYICLIVKLAG